jgi:hypothetical protein
LFVRLRAAFDSRRTTSMVKDKNDAPVLSLANAPAPQTNMERARP